MAVEIFSQFPEKAVKNQAFPQHGLWKNLWTMWITSVKNRWRACGKKIYVPRTCVRKHPPAIPAKGFRIFDSVWHSYIYRYNGRCGSPPSTVEFCPPCRRCAVKDGCLPSRESGMEACRRLSREIFSEGGDTYNFDISDSPWSFGFHRQYCVTRAVSAR